ncbi:hypothetical protein, partial [Candidatus Methylomicrobium oryzae]|uniref:hypothetical protein n=1 Tax=Candidatus Methylomicrobium oryzae TaxID=2802053 RepID=UPI001F447739
HAQTQTAVSVRLNLTALGGVKPEIMVTRLALFLQACTLHARLCALHRLELHVDPLKKQRLYCLCETSYRRVCRSFEAIRMD